MFDRETSVDRETNSGKDILFREHDKISGEQRVRRKSKQFNMIAKRYKTGAQIIKMWYVTLFDPVEWTLIHQIIYFPFYVG